LIRELSKQSAFFESQVVGIRRLLTSNLFLNGVCFAWKNLYVHKKKYMHGKFVFVASKNPKNT
jgi:hypothetical protein